MSARARLLTSNRNGNGLTVVGEVSEPPRRSTTPRTGRSDRHGRALSWKNGQPSEGVPCSGTLAQCPWGRTCLWRGAVTARLGPGTVPGAPRSGAQPNGMSRDHQGSAQVMNIPRGRPRTLRDGGRLCRGHAAPKPNHLHEMVGVQYMWCILYC